MEPKQTYLKKLAINTAIGAVSGYIAAKYFKNEAIATAVFLGSSIGLNMFYNEYIESKEDKEALAKVNEANILFFGVAWAASWGVFLFGPFNRTGNYMLSGATIPLVYGGYSYLNYNPKSEK